MHRTRDHHRYIGPGRPLGFHIEPGSNGQVLLVCDSVKGLVRFDRSTNELRILSNRVSNGVRSIWLLIMAYPSSNCLLQLRLLHFYCFACLGCLLGRPLRLCSFPCGGKSSTFCSFSCGRTLHLLHSTDICALLGQNADFGVWVNVHLLLDPSFIGPCTLTRCALNPARDLTPNCREHLQRQRLLVLGTN